MPIVKDFSDNSPVTLEHMARAFDLRGSVFLVKQRLRPRYCLRIACSFLTEDQALLFKTRLQGVIHKKGKIWKWEVGTVQAQHTIEQFMPWLDRLKSRVLIGLEFQGTKRRGNREDHITEREIKIEHEIHARLVEANMFADKLHKLKASKKELVREYKDGASMSSLAKKYDVTLPAIAYQLKIARVTVRPGNGKIVVEQSSTENLELV